VHLIISLYNLNLLIKRDGGTGPKMSRQQTLIGVLCQIQQADFCLKDKESVFYKLKDLFLLCLMEEVFFMLKVFLAIASMKVLFTKNVRRISAVTHVMGKIKRGVHHECKQ
jgi:hypothetical protein